jgi:hypothetical protein
VTTRHLRTLKHDGAVFRWRVDHLHRRGADQRCAEALAAFLDGFPRAALRVIFPESAGHGPGYIRQSGVVVDYRAPKWSVELHRPRTALILIELGRSEGWDPRAAPRREHVISNGYDLLRANPAALARALEPPTVVASPPLRTA